MGSLKGNEMFCEVSVDYICDRFNLTGLREAFSYGLIEAFAYYDQALGLISDHEQNMRLSEDESRSVQTEGERLYGMIHARYILTTQGLHTMLDKYRQCHFGRCPRVMCQGQPCLPVGIADTIGQEPVKLYCPGCEDVYKPESSRYAFIDGAFFGTTFPHLFFLTFPELKITKTDA